MLPGQKGAGFPEIWHSHAQAGGLVIKLFTVRWPTSLHLKTGKKSVLLLHLPSPWWLTAELIPCLTSWSDRHTGTHKHSLQRTVTHTDTHSKEALWWRNVHRRCVMLSRIVRLLTLLSLKFNTYLQNHVYHWDFLVFKNKCSCLLD